MKRLIYIIIASLICSSFILGCKSKKNIDSSAANVEKSSQEEKFQILFFEAQKEKAIENYAKSYEKFQASLEFNNKEDAVYYELSKLDTLNGNYSGGLDKIKKAVALTPNNLWYARLQADIEVETGDFSGAMNTLKSIAERDPRDVNYRDKLASLAIYKEDYKTAIQSYDEIESIVGVNEDLTKGKYEIFKIQGDKQRGLLELQKLSESSPNNLAYLRNIAAHFNETGEPSKGIEIYERIVQLDPEDGDTQLALAEIYSAQGKWTKSNTALEKGFSDPASSVDKKIQILVSIIQSKDPNVKMDVLIQSIQQAYPSSADVWKISGEAADASGQTAIALDNYKTALELEPNNLELWKTVSKLEIQNGDFEGLEKTSKDAQLLFPLQPIFYFNEATAHTKKGDTENAISALETGKSFIINNDNLKATFYSALGSSYSSANDFEKSDQAFQKAIQLNATDPYIKNDYAFSLAQRKRSLDNAKVLIQEAVNLLPNHPSFEDTYAFLHFQNEELELAQKWILKSLENGGDDFGNILEHAGDIYSTAGKKAEALEYWRKAKSIGGTSNLIEKKIANEKYVTE